MNRIKICNNFSDSTQIKMKDNFIGNKTKETQICFKGYYVINLRNNINFSYLTNLYFQFFFHNSDFIFSSSKIKALFLAFKSSNSISNPWFEFFWGKKWLLIRKNCETRYFYLSPKLNAKVDLDCFHLCTYFLPMLSYIRPGHSLGGKWSTSSMK